MKDLETILSFVCVYDLVKTRASSSVGYKEMFSVVEMKDVRPRSTFVLLVFDYLGLYVPILWVMRFHYLHMIVAVNDSQWKQSSLLWHTMENKILVIDLTEDLHRCTQKMEDMVDFSYFHESLFCIFQGHSPSFITTKHRAVIRFLLPFIDFLTPTSVEMEYWKQKSQYSFLF